MLRTRRNWIIDIDSDQSIQSKIENVDMTLNKNQRGNIGFYAIVTCIQGVQMIIVYLGNVRQLILGTYSQRIDTSTILMSVIVCSFKEITTQQHFPGENTALFKLYNNCYMIRRPNTISSMSKSDVSIKCQSHRFPMLSACARTIHRRPVDEIHPPSH